MSHKYAEYPSHTDVGTFPLTPQEISVFDALIAENESRLRVEELAELQKDSESVAQTFPDDSIQSLGLEADSLRAMSQMGFRMIDQLTGFSRAQILESCLAAEAQTPGPWVDLHFQSIFDDIEAKLAERGLALKDNA